MATTVFDQSSALTGTDDGGGSSNENHRYLLPTALLTSAAGNNQVRVSVRTGTGNTGASPSINSMWIGQASGTNDNFIGDQVQLKFSGSASLNFATGLQTATSDWVTLSQTWDASKQYAVSFHVDTSASGFHNSVATVSGVTEKWNAAADSSGQTAPSLANTVANKLEFVEKLEVQTTTPAYSSKSLGTTSNTSGATVVLTTTVDCPNNSLLIVCVEDGSTTLATDAPVLSVGGTLTALNSVYKGNNNSAANGSANWFYCYVNADFASSSTITYTKKTSGSTASIGAYFITAGQTDGGAPAVTGTATTGSSTAPSITATVGATTQLVLGFATATKKATVCSPPQTGAAWLGGFPQLTGTSTIAPLCSYLTYGVSGSTTFNPPLSVTDTWSCFMVAFNAASTETTSEDKYHQPWSERPRASIAAGLAVALAAASGPTFVNPVPTDNFVQQLGWKQPLSEPVRVKLGLGANQQQPIAFVSPVPIDAFIQRLGWRQNLSEPARTRPFNTCLQQQPALTIVTGEVITSDKWFSWLSEPTRQRTFAVSQQQAFATSPQPFVSFSWFKPISTPVRLKPGLSAWLQQSFTADTSVIPVSTLMPWFGNLSEPQRLKVGTGFPSFLQQAFATDTSVIPASKLIPWFAQLSDPVRVKQGLPAGLQQSTAFSFFPIEVITLDKWFATFSDPVRQKVGLGALLQQWLAHDPQPFAADYGYFSWYTNLRDPTRRPSSLHVYPAAFNVALAFAETITLDKWLYGLSEPVRTRFLATAHQPFTTLARPPLVSFSWMEGLSEPVRQRLFATAQQPFTAVLHPRPFVSFGWIEPLSEPQRSKPRLLAGLQPFDAFVNPAPTSAFIQRLGWRQWLSEPVRIKLGLLSGLQQFSTSDTVLIPAPAKIFAGWDVWLAEPVRLKPGLHSSQQEFLVWAPQTVTITPVTFILTATEQGDIASFILSGMYGKPRANVSIVEIDTKYSEASIWIKPWYKG